MNESTSKKNVDTIAAEVMTALESCRQIEPLTKTSPMFDLEKAYAVTARVRALRTARGEKCVGRKIGFTNRNIWAEYGVFAPIWGDMYDTTVRDLPGPDEPFQVSHFPEPRIEPEIVFGLAAAPHPAMDENALLGCIEWVAHGFEIVQSVFPQWQFKGADTVAAFGLHAALLIGPRFRMEGNEEWLRALSSFEIVLHCGPTEIDRGQGRDLLGGPLSALRHLVGLLAEDRSNPPLAAGEIVTTGTVTRAFPIRPGEVWRTDVIGLPVPGLRVWLC